MTFTVNRYRQGLLEILKMCCAPFAAYFALQLTMLGKGNCCMGIIHLFANKFFHLINI